MLPGVAESLLAAQVPHVQVDSALLHALKVKANGRYRVLVEAPVRQNAHERGLARVVEPNDGNLNLLAPKL